MIVDKIGINEDKREKEENVCFYLYQSVCNLVCSQINCLIKTDKTVKNI